MRKVQVQAIIAYYGGIHEMAKMLKLERAELEEEYNALRGVAMDGMPHSMTVGDQTAAAAERADGKNVRERLAEINVKLAVLDADAAEIRGCLDALHGEYKRMVILREVRDYTWVRISAETGIPYSTARRCYDRAMERLGEALDDVPMAGELLDRASRARL